MKKKENIVATFSIVGFDPETGELGVAVQSKFLAVGSVVPWAKAGVGAIATQALANVSYGEKGLDLLSQGKSPEEVIEHLTAEDDNCESRQVGIVDTSGNSATFTGKECFDWAGSISGENFSAQGNILVGEETVKAMATTFQNTEESLADRLLASLSAGQEAGGDSRGRQSAALYVVKENGGYGGYNDHYIDLRVDDHTTPIKELKRLYDIFLLYFGDNDSESLKIDNVLKTEITNHLKQLNHYTNGKDFTKAMESFYHTENFEERKLKEGYIDKDILEYMRQKLVQNKK